MERACNVRCSQQNLGTFFKSNLVEEKTNYYDIMTNVLTRRIRVLLNNGPIKMSRRKTRAILIN